MERICINRVGKTSDMEEFEKVTRPVIEWLQKNGYPHDYILIEYASAELLNGKMGYSVDKIKESEE